MITVITEATVEPITVTEAKEWLGIQTTTHDAKLTAAIPAARKKVEQLSGRSMVVRTVKYTVQEWSGAVIELPYPVVSTIVSVKSMDSSGVETTHTAANYSLVYNRLHFVGNGNSVEITYTTAANAEQFYKLAIKKQLAYDYRNEYTENGFDQEVIKMISSVTLNLGY
jgi:hypothetical protein